MSLKTKVQQAVDIAFEKLKDLAVTATFDNKVVSGFDFAMGTTESVSNTYSTIGFLERKKSFWQGLLITKTTLTIKTDPLINFDRYSTVSIDNVEYNCSLVSKDDFVTIISISGE